MSGGARNRSALPLLLAALLAAGLGACGGEETTTTAGGDSPEAAIAGFVAALDDGDADAACALLSAETLADLEVAGSCEVVLGEGIALIEEQGVAVPAYEIKDLEVDGDTATVTLHSTATDDPIDLVREGGEWKLAGTTTLEQIHPDAPLDSGAASGEGEVGG